MGKLSSLSTRQVLKALRKAGFVDAPTRGKGSHQALVKTDPMGRAWLVIVPERKSIPIGTLHGILKQAGLSREEFIELL